MLKGSSRDLVINIKLILNRHLFLVSSANLLPSPSTRRILFPLHVSDFVPCHIERRRGVSPLRSSADRLESRAPLRSLRVPMDTTVDLLHPALHEACRLRGSQARTCLQGLFVHRGHHRLTQSRLPGHASGACGRGDGDGPNGNTPNGGSLAH